MLCAIQIVTKHPFGRAWAIENYGGAAATNSPNNIQRSLWLLRPHADADARRMRAVIINVHQDCAVCAEGRDGASAVEALRQGRRLRERMR